MTRLKKLTAIAALAALSLTYSIGAAHAERPDRQGAVSGQSIMQIYAGKTWVWSEGGSFWAKDGSFQAVGKGTSVGTGKWYVSSKGTLCYEATWHSGKGQPGKELKRCWKHVVDSEGTLWKQDMNSKEWYRPKREFAERLQAGNKIRRAYNRLVRKYGL